MIRIRRNPDLARDNLAAYRDQAIQDEHDRQLSTCLGAGCCPQCGRPLGLVRQKDGSNVDYHHPGGRCQD